MSALRKSLLQLLFSGFYIRRWNDKLRPKELYEIDKQAHKMLVAFVLTQVNSRSFSAPDRIELQQKIVEKSFFDYLYRLIITDIKPPVFYQIRENKKQYMELTEWVLDSLRPVVEPLDPAPGGLWSRMQAYCRSLERNELSDRILDAAHLYASGWEFGLIKPFNPFDEEAQSIDNSFAERLDAIRDVAGLDEVRRPNSALGRFAKLSGQLRFQIRWSGTPRIPETSVLGHMYLVGLFAYCFSTVVGACRARCVNNFFAGLFHDLPELLTRDIISPVKRSSKELDKFIKQYELAEMKKRIFEPLTASGDHHDIVARLHYYLGLEGVDVESEFDDTVRLPDGTVQRLTNFNDLHANGNTDEQDPKDGQLLKACDNLAAYLEAHTSISRGITSPDLQHAVVRIATEFRTVNLGPLSLGTLMADFD